MLGLKATHAHPHFHKPQMNEVRRIYWSHSLRLIAANLVTIFIPIYLLNLNYDLGEIILYYLMMAVLWGVLQYPILKISNRIGTNKAMVVSFVLQFSQLVLLATLPIMGWPLWALSIAWALYVAFYWPCFRASFAKGLDGKHPGRSVGISNALTTVAYGIAPAVGGIVATIFGITSIYIAAMVILALAAVPLLTGPEIIKNDPFDLSKLRLGRVKRDLIANAASEVDDMALSIIWPLLIFLIFPTYAGVGILSSIAVISGIVISLYVGRREERRGVRHYLNEGVAVTAFSNAGRLVADTTASIATVNLFSGFGHALLNTPYITEYYKEANKEPRLAYMYGMMVACAIADSLFFALMFALAQVVPDKTVLAAGLAAIVPITLAIRLIR